MAVKGGPRDPSVEVDAVSGQLLQAIDTGDLSSARVAAEKVTRLLDDQTLLMQRLEHLSRLEELGRMTAELIHELRQPLLGVKAFGQMLQGRAHDEEFVKQRAAKILTQVSRMESIVDRSKRFSREHEPRLQTVDLSLAIDEARELLQPRLLRLGIELRLELEEPLPAVLADPGELQQIFVNLISNACEAVAPSDGVIVIRTALGDAHVVVSVLDNGPGVPDDLRERIFEPFVSTKESGTGIGLLVCRRIARSFGGDVSLAEGTEGTEGARFDLTLLRREPTRRGG